MRVKIISNPLKQWAMDLGNELKDRLISYEMVDKGEDITIIIGGDGTLLYNKEKVEGIAILIGSKTSKRAHINVERKDDFDPVFKKLLVLLKHPSYLSLPFIEVYSLKSSFFALNDVVIRSNDHKVIYTHINSLHFKENDIGDGLIVSTPFGSLGYNKSVFGSEIKLNTDAFSLSFISSINRKIPIVFPPSEIQVKVRGNADLIVDGEKKVENVKEVLIRSSKKSVKYYYNPFIKP